jgi:hypothetical protein
MGQTTQQREPLIFESFQRIPIPLYCCTSIGYQSHHAHSCTSSSIGRPLVSGCAHPEPPGFGSVHSLKATVRSVIFQRSCAASQEVKQQQGLDDVEEGEEEEGGGDKEGEAWSADAVEQAVGEGGSEGSGSAAAMDLDGSAAQVAPSQAAAAMAAPSQTQTQAEGTSVYCMGPRLKPL